MKGANPIAWFYGALCREAGESLPPEAGPATRRGFNDQGLFITRYAKAQWLKDENPVQVEPVGYGMALPQKADEPYYFTQKQRDTLAYCVTYSGTYSDGVSLSEALELLAILQRV